VTYEISVRRLSEQRVASIVIPGIPPAAVGAALEGALPDVFSHLQAHEVPIVGAPFARYHAAVGGTLDLEVGIPVGGPFPETDRVRARSLPGGEVIGTAHVGGHGRLPETVRALAEWRAAHGRVPAGAYWEVYAEGPPPLGGDDVKTEVLEPLA
jgi:effector-binding domain-containing protein